MDDKNDKDLIAPPTENDPNLKVYRCPHCKNFLFKGNVRKLNMKCHHCQIMIGLDGQSL